ncbi:hypothetical protein BKA83DRAFT_4044275 [Pisolithus microcarpus]|nr:hypothetical protein BKA83DRAFT_4044275 [Pisolithus microcarpus]
MFPASILADNQAVIRASVCPSSKPGHHLLLSFRSTLHKVSRSERLTRDSITVCWILGHREVEGNELADKEAKVAAEGKEKMSLVTSLPPKLCSPLPHSISALKQQHNTKLLSAWRKEWKCSPRFCSMVNINPELPSKSFIKLAGALHKKQTGLYIQLCTNHAPLNHHLHQINRSEHHCAFNAVK